MTKRGMLLYGFLAIAMTLPAQVTITASAPKVVEAGEEITLTYTMNAEPSEFRAPNLSAFTILAGPSRSSSSSISIINGRISQSVTITYTYVLQANQEGKYTIDPARITVDGKTYYSNSLTIEVVGSSHASTSTPKPQQPGESSSRQEDNIPDEKVFLKVIVDKTSLYQGECLTATVKFYSQLNVNDLGNLQLPRFNGVYSQEIETPQIRLNRENINGKIYLTGVIKQYYLFFQQSGEIVIEPFSLDAVVALKAGTRPRTPFDDFWGFEPEPVYQWVKKTVKSKPLKISVKPLPAGAPASFKGAVGNYSFKAMLDKNKVKTNEAITLKAIVNGTGNIKLIEPVEPKIPADFEAFDPKTNLTLKGITGNKTFEYVMIPRSAGTFTIPSLEFAYFDPQSRQYKILRSEDFTITVEKGKDDESSKGGVYVASSRNDIKYLGKDILFIKPGPVPAVREGQWFFGSKSFYLTYIFSVLATGIFIVLMRKQIAENANIARQRTRRASRQAKKRLMMAGKYLKQNQKEMFYEEVLKALWGYVSDKFNIPAADLSREKIKDILQDKGISAEDIESLTHLLDVCELARYAPAAAPENLQEIFEQAENVINRYEAQVIKTIS